MKHHIKYFILLAVLFSSCTKLEETIVDTPSGASIKKESDVTAALQGAYGILLSPELFKVEGYNLLTLAADDISALANPTFNPYSQKIYGPSTATIAPMYNSLYAIVNNCNFLLEKITTLNLSPVYKTRAEGEIKFIRAVGYFYLVRMFGGVPLRTASTNSNTDFFVKRNTADEVYGLIISDLKTASANLLPKSQPSAIGLANKGAAQAMLSLVYLTYGNYLDFAGKNAVETYTSAKIYADSVILSGAYSLVDNYADLWDVDKETTAYAREVIWGLRFTRDAGSADINSEGSEYAIRYLPGTAAGMTGIPATASVPQGVGRGQFKIQPWFYDICTKGDYVNDYRTGVTYLTSWKQYQDGQTVNTYPLNPTAAQLNPAGVTLLTPNTYNQPYLKKYVDAKGIDTRTHENDLFVIRLAEIYLIKAEALNEINSGPTPDAYSAFNMVRARSRKADGVARAFPADLQPGLSQNDFRMKIFNERGVEFIGEAKRWFDLVRMKSPTGTTMYQYQFDTYLKTITKNLPTWNGTTKTWVGGRTMNNTIGDYQSRLLLFPIPVSQTDINPLIEPNPGY